MTGKTGRVTVSSLRKMKTQGEKIVMVTAYDYPSAALVDAAGVDIILIGDSLGNVVQGRESTLSVTLDQMIYHTEMVVRAAKRAMVILDMPFPYCQLGPEEAVRAAARVVKETGVAAIKVEGGEKRRGTIQALIDAGIPVMGHCGLMPQSIKLTGTYRVERDCDRLLHDAIALQECGVFSLLFECVPKAMAGEIVKKVEVPIIGIGAGNGCDGQVLVFHDMMGFYPDTDHRLPKHAKCYASLSNIILDATEKYIDDVRSGAFPADEQSF